MVRTMGGGFDPIGTADPDNHHFDDGIPFYRSDTSNISVPPLFFQTSGMEKITRNFSDRFRIPFQRLRQFQKSSKMAENSCCDLQMERFRWLPCGYAQTTIPNSSTIFFQPNFAGLLKLPQTENVKTEGSIYSSQDRDHDSLHELR